MFHFFRFKEVPGQNLVDSLSAEHLTSIEKKLNSCICQTRKEEAEIILSILTSGENGTPIEEAAADFSGPISNAAVKAPQLTSDEKQYCFRLLLNTVKKFAFKKYKTDYLEIAEKVKTYARECPGASEGLIREMERIDEIARLRFGG